MDRTLIAVRNLVDALDAPLYDLGVLSEKGMLPGLASLPSAAVFARLSFLKAHNARGAHIYIRPAGEHRFTVLDDLTAEAVEDLRTNGYAPCAVVETSTGNFQTWLKHDDIYPTQLSTFVAQNLAQRFHGDPSAADWRRFGRLPGFTNCKPKYRKPNGLYPYVLLRSCTGEIYPMAPSVRLELTKSFQLQEEGRRVRVAESKVASFSPDRGPRYSHLSVERFRTLPKFHDRPAAADLAFCVAALSLSMPETMIADTLDEEYLSRDPSPTRKAAYIRRTIDKARSWASR